MKFKVGDRVVINENYPMDDYTGAVPDPKDLAMRGLAGTVVQSIPKLGYIRVQLDKTPEFLEFLDGLVALRPREMDLVKDTDGE